MCLLSCHTSHVFAVFFFFFFWGGKALKGDYASFTVSPVKVRPASQSAAALTPMAAGVKTVGFLTLHSDGVAFRPGLRNLLGDIGSLFRLRAVK